MEEWLFLDYIERNGNPIRDWLEDKASVPTKARAKIQRILLQLAGTRSWTRPLASNLDDYPGIVEIRIRWMNTQYRLLGYRGPGEREFTLLFPATEKDDKFVPLNAPTIATNRMSIVQSDRSRVCEHRFG
ncbi:MAG TPA: hypothetical protein VMQ56_09230 [Terracidiphilus sp.]|jgi:hypothetical protein|nr:hypothetical protein [Terracidiphilus sp.]